LATLSMLVLNHIRLAPVKIYAYAVSVLTGRRGKYSELSWVTDRLAVGDIALSDNPQLARGENVDYVLDVRHLFTEDMGLRVEKADRFADGVAMLLGAGYRVALHCYGGIDRSPFIAAMILAKHMDISLESAYNLVLRKRVIAFRHPEWIRVTEQFYDYWDVVDNS